MYDDLSSSGIGATWYVWRRIPLRHDETTRALGALLRSGSSPGVAATGVAVERLHHARPGDARGFVGRLPLGRIFGAPRVEVEVEPWSHTESTIAVRPLDRAPRLRASRYFERAFAVLDRLEALLLARAVEPTTTEMRRAS
jgi:hypothetical protein